METPSWFQPQVAVVEAVVTLMAPHLEVVLHDVGEDRVVAMWNASSGRSTGEESLLQGGPLGGDEVLGPYAKVDRHGRTWTSVSVPVAAGRGLLCLNFDRSALDDAARSITQFLAPVTPQPAALFDRDWRAEIDAMVGARSRDRGQRAGVLTSVERLELVRDLERSGVFEIRHAAAYVARVLDVSRATLYGQLKQVRTENVTRPLTVGRQS